MVAHSEPLWMGTDFEHYLNENLLNFALNQVVWFGSLTFHSTFNALTVHTHCVHFALSLLLKSADHYGFYRASREASCQILSQVVFLKQKHNTKNATRYKGVTTSYTIILLVILVCYY